MIHWGTGLRTFFSFHFKVTLQHHFESTRETIRLILDGEHRTVTSTFAQFLSSEKTKQNKQNKQTNKQKNTTNLKAGYIHIQNNFNDNNNKSAGGWKAVTDSDLFFCA